MKNAILIIILFALGATYASGSILTKSEIELKVGSNPVAILENPDTGIISIFCAGVDANDNKEIDEGEEQPSWWKYNPNGSSLEPTKVMDFKRFFVDPFKPSIYSLDGVTVVSIPKNNEIGSSKINGYSVFEMQSSKSLTSTGVTGGEFVYSKRISDRQYSIVRYESESYLFVINVETDQNSSKLIDGNLINFATFKKGGKEYWVPIYFDGENTLMDVFEIDQYGYYIRKIEKQTLYDNVSVTDAFNSYGVKLFLVSENKNRSLLYTYDEEQVVMKPWPWIFENGKKDNYIAGITDDIQVRSKDSKDIFVTNLEYGDIKRVHEMHRAAFEVGYMKRVGDYFFCANEENNDWGYGKVAVYNITDKERRDSSLINQAFVEYNPVGLYDLGIHPREATYTVSQGIDNNGNGIFEESDGDIPTTITTHSFGPILEEGDIPHRFDFQLNFPLKSNINRFSSSATDGSIYLPSGNNIYSFNTIHQTISDTLVTDMYVACVYGVLDYMVIGQRDLEEGKSYIRIIKEDQIDVKTEVGYNVVDCIIYQNESGFGVVSISEGTDGESDSKLNIIKLSTQGISDNTVLDIGSGAVSIVANPDQTEAAIVMHGSHEVHILNLLTGEINNTIPTETSGLGGPRDAVFYNNMLYVTTYSNRILVIDLTEGEQVGYLNVDGDTEAIITEHNYIYVTNIKYNNNEPNNRLIVYDIDKITNVEYTKSPEQAVRIYPNPVVDELHIVSDDITGTYDIVIFDEQGRVVASKSGNNTSEIGLSVKTLGLSSGTYTALINNKKTVRFVVVR